MANRYGTLVGSKKISEDFQTINVGFDRVQAEMDTKGTPADAQAKADAAKAAAIAAAAADLAAHKARGADEHPTAKGNAAGFMSAADKLKSDASTSAATPDTLMQRDAAGRAKVTAPAAADDIARKAETDAVQTNLESHAADTDIHVTADDHDKLNGIAAGAEVNQNAFSGVNGVVATSKSDTLQITGGTGITITEDPATKRVIVTSTGTATPGAHASSHVTGGSDVIPDAVIDGASGLMSGGDAKFVRVDGETKTGAQAKADEVKDYIESRLDNPERASITLQPGIHVVQADQDAAFKLAGLQGRTVLNYQSQIGIFGVLNPYVIRYGANLLQPFYEWESGIATGDSLTLDNPYKATIKATTIGGSFVRCWVPVKPLQKYTVSVTAQGSNARPYIYLCRADRSRIDSIKLPFGTVTPSAETTYLEIVLNTLDSGSNPTTGTAVFTDVTMVIGATALPFVPRDDAMLALQTELHANPDSGDNPDMVFERDGQYFKLAKWCKVVLDGKYDYAILNNYVGYKRVLVTASLPPKSGTSYATKYTGTQLVDNDTAAASDRYDINSSGIILSISNTDSGWGDSYTPTVDEIKAYFMGWRMYDGSQTGNPYNGTGTKTWNSIKHWGTPTYFTTTLPTTQAPEWTPYQLLYQLATPVVEPITSEGQLTFFEGDNQVEIGTGIVLRESAKPQVSDYGTYINSAFPGFEQTKLKYRTSKILTLFKDSKFDPSWVRNTLDAYGAERAVLSAYDPAAAYSVTYLMLDKYPTVDFTGTYAQNEKALLLDAVRTLQENTTRISLLESKKAEKDSPAWIAPTLLNNWINYGGSEDGAGYRRDSDGYVHLRGLVKLGVAGGMVFKLPIGYRPKSTLRLPVTGAAKFGEMTIGVDGGIYFNASIDGTYVSMFIPPFAAEQ